MQSHRTDYEAVTAAGKVIRTFGDEKTGRIWVNRKRNDFPGLDLFEVTTTVQRRRLRTTALRAVA
ncbi:hypothetical protein [Phenylobacterium sp. 58.2.17]|uniref:hypothetical protein n=1 Tax=Phenylobacterium sp. 58.2.17 TaxID=2969306 RepID=UPI002264F38C|nr:hypothetical protein [Phenylobacterium sp. 58.2.17]MCX7585048.1 hypothetical protein [Phenylobacterium sp. 58.2.17]